MGSYHDKSKNVKRVIDSVVDYLLENRQRNYATAVQNAAGRVLTYESGQMRTANYSRKINRWLCEALFFMNSDPNCTQGKIKAVRCLIEGYRNMNGMSTDDFVTDTGDAVADVESDETFSNAADGLVDEVEIDSPVAEYICNNTLCGQEYSIDDICNDVGMKKLLSAANVTNHRDSVLGAVNDLVNKHGMFEITSRDPELGQTIMIYRIK